MSTFASASAVLKPITLELNQAAALSSNFVEPKTRNRILKVAIPGMPRSIRHGRTLRFKNVDPQGSHGTRGRLVRASYTRRPMETPGAYELIDNSTGEKFIIWGGNDNDHYSPVPSQEVLSSKFVPSSDHAKSGGNGGNQVFSRGVGNFGRLKAQKIKDLVRKSYTKKQYGSDRHFKQEPPGTGFEADLVLSKEPHVLKRDKSFRIPENSSRPIETKETVDTMDQAITMGRHDHAEDRPLSRASSASLRGWGNGVPVDQYRSSTQLISEKLRGVNYKNEFFSRKSFKDLGCTDYVIESLRSQLLVRPSNIQAMAFAPVIQGKSCIIADQSGSGKTLAYLLPVVQRLREEELLGLGKPLPGSPRVVILTPTAELASQVLNNCRSMSRYGVPFRSMVVTGGFRQKTQLDNLRQEMDVLIATPGRFVYLIKEGFLQLTNLKCAVLDEIDVLFNDEDFELGFKSLVNSSPVTTQYLFVTATLPVEIYSKLVESFPDCQVIMGPGMHRTSSGLEEILIDCSGDEGTEKTPETAFINKRNALLQLVEESPVSKTIVFCNKIETCRKVENALKRCDRKGISTRVLPFHAALEQQTRVANINEFRNSQSKNSSLFLVCTDRASRGIDFQGVDHVVLFDFPRDPSEYVRRVGRTARAGGRGKAFVLVVGKQVSLARRIIERNKKGYPLHDVPAAY